jgi:hypothetical protein
MSLLTRRGPTVAIALFWASVKTGRLLDGREGAGYSLPLMFMLRIFVLCTNNYWPIEARDERACKHRDARRVQPQRGGDDHRQETDP